jgi:flagellar hook-associated protein 1 FlgK
MYSTFYGLELANRALATHQAALDVAGHNIANSNTKGYTRQLPNIQTASPFTIKAGGRDLTMGAGSTMDNILRARDNYIDRQYRWESSKLEYWSAREKALSLIEGTMNEPSKYSLHNDLGGFWNAWSVLANNPQNSGARSVLAEKAMTLTDTFHHINQQIIDLKSDLDSTVVITIRQINNIADRIKDLNVQIKRAEVGMDNPNDLKDARDALVDELSQLVPVRVIETQDPAFTDRIVGNYKIIIGNDSDPNNVLLDDQAVRHLVDPPPKLDGVSRVAWAEPVTVSGDDLGTTGNIEIDAGDVLRVVLNGVGYNLDLYSAVGGTEPTYAYDSASYGTLAAQVETAINNLIENAGRLEKASVQFDGNKFVFSLDTGGAIGLESITGPGIDDKLTAFGFPFPDRNNNYVDLGSEMGTLKSNITVRDEYLQDYKERINDLVKALANAVNDIHKTGQGLVPKEPDSDEFFTYDDSDPIATIKLNEVLKSDQSKIASGIISDPLEVGDNSVALKIASLAEGWQGLLEAGGTPGLDSSSLGDYYGALISKLGVDVQQSQRMAEGQAVLVNYMGNQRESVSGVSLDEEMANLLKFQKSYGAAARLVTMLDSMFERILGMGVTR